MGFSAEADLRKIRKKLTGAKGTLMPTPNATPLETFRWDICQKFVAYKQKYEFTLEEMAENLGTDKAEASKILRRS